MQHLRCSPTCHKPHKQLPYNLQKHNTNTWQNTLLACTVTECNCTDSVHCNWWSPWRPLHWLITGKAICNSGLAFWQAGASRQNLSASVGFAFWPATGALPLDLSGGLLSPHPLAQPFTFSAQRHRWQVGSSKLKSIIISMAHAYAEQKWWWQCFRC